MPSPAMKAFAARPRDVADLRTLTKIAGIESLDEALRICRDFYPDEILSPRAEGVLREIFSTD